MAIAQDPNRAAHEALKRAATAARAAAKARRLADALRGRRN
ncbi:hypothetical protein [Streptomyces gilvosporeus]